MLPLMPYFHKELAVVSFCDFPGVRERWRGAPAGPRPSSADARSPHTRDTKPHCEHLAAVTQPSRKRRTRGENGPSWTGRLSVREINDHGPENTQWGSTFPNLKELLNLALLTVVLSLRSREPS